MMLKSSAVTKASRAQTCVVRSSQQNTANVCAAAIASFMLATQPAFAGVILEQPQLKKVFQGESTPAAAASAAGAKPAAKAAPKKKAEAVESSGGIAPQALALPAALVVVGGGTFALSAVDEGFGEFMRTAAVKDSAADGAGYETDIKVEGAFGKKKGGTQKVGTKKGGKSK